MKNFVKKGFTLIELLVVITIIGILATGAVATFTSQIQKSRDATRISSIKALQSAVEQVYQDKAEYPHSNEFATGSTNISAYLETFPADPKHGQSCNGGTTCAYAYRPAEDGNTIAYGSYELSIAFENSGNRENKAETDAGQDSLRAEFGSRLSNIATSLSGAITTSNQGEGACLSTSSGPATTGTELIVINGNPTTAGNNCN